MFPMAVARARGVETHDERTDGSVATLARPVSAAAIRSGVERGDPFAYVRNAPMGARVDPGERVGGPRFAPLTARADEAVPHDLHSPDAQLGVISANPDGLDVRSMEHERQSRLQRWQRLPTL